MTSEQLIAEGRKLQRPCALLTPERSGEAVAIWHEGDEEEIESSGHHRWLTVDSRQIPGLPTAVSGYVSLFTDENKCEGGRIEITPSWPKTNGTQLYAHKASILPPLDAVFRRGSNAVEEWLLNVGWQRDWRYNSNFKDKAVIAPYREIFQQEFPIYSDSDNIYATLGGWHFPGPDDDWEELIDEQLMVMTFRDSEPWVEAWRMRTGEFKVIQRIT